MNIEHAKRNVILLLTCAFCFAACNNKPHFTLKGKIDGAAGATLYLYKRGITGLDLMDSAKIGKDATFEIKSPAPKFPDLYVLTLGKQIINLAVDSLDVIQITAKKSSFDTGYELKGSPQSENIRQLFLAQKKTENELKFLKSQYDKKEITDSVYIKSAQKIITDFKNKSQNTILNNLREMSSYYALFQKVNGQSLFDPLNKSDSRFYSAVATAWDTFHQGSPRSEHLKNFTLNAIARRRAMEGKLTTSASTQTSVSATDFFNIKLPGKDERTVELKSLKGKVVLVDFTMYKEQWSPDHNVQLNKAYQILKKSGFEIFQVAFTSDIQFWRTSANNLPWICVREDDPNSELTSRYNIQSLPAMYLINRQGEIVKRIDPNEDIASAVRKVL